AVPSASQRRAAGVERPAAGDGNAGAVTPAEVAKPKQGAPVRSGQTPRSPGGVTRGPVSVQPPEDDGTGHTGHDDVGSVLLCTDVTRPCEPPPPGGADS
ncbi:MAG: hypothetical protein ACRDJM_03355, partial [Actinomycetota bacterium]